MVLLAALAWCGYWIAAAAAIDGGVTAWLKDRRAAGWQAETASVDTGGFPFRFSTRIDALTLADPRAGLAWSLPRLDLSASGLRPTRVTVDTGATQRLATPVELLTLTSARSVGLLHLQAGPRLELREASFDLEGITVVSDRGWQAGLATAGFSTLAVGNDAHQLSFSGQGFAPPQALRRAVDPAGLLPPTFDSLDIVATLDFDAPWDRHAIEQRRPQFEAINVETFVARWGPMELRAAGQVSVDENGTPEGELALQVRDWERMLDLAEAAQLIPADARPTVEKTLAFLARLSGGSDTLDVPLGFRRGVMLIGPLPVGPAPKLVLR